MPEQFIPKSFRLPPDIIDALAAESKANLRNDTAQLIYILRERYARTPRLEDKQKRGNLKK
jgi:hypothetical protein